MSGRDKARLLRRPTAFFAYRLQFSLEKGEQKEHPSQSFSTETCVTGKEMIWPYTWMTVTKVYVA